MRSIWLVTMVQFPISEKAMSKWKAKETLLIVGEGYSEVAFLNHVKQLFSERVDGRQIKIKNAKGKGAKHVVDWTIRQTFNADYDRVAVVFDTDTTCWNSDVRKKSGNYSIELLTSEPCFEAMLLRVLGKPDGGDAKALKKRFATKNYQHCAHSDKHSR